MEYVLLTSLPIPSLLKCLEKLLLHLISLLIRYDILLSQQCKLYLFTYVLDYMLLVDVTDKTISRYTRFCC